MSKVRFWWNTLILRRRYVIGCDPAGPNAVAIVMEIRRNGQRRFIEMRPTEPPAGDA